MEDPCSCPCPHDESTAGATDNAGGHADGQADGQADGRADGRADSHADGQAGGHAGGRADDLVLSVDVGRKNLALCVLRAGEDVRGANDTIVHWAVVSCEPTPNGIAGAMDALDLTGVTEAVIERQPPRNPTMCRLQHYIEMFCALRGLRVVVQDAKHKLAFAASTPWWPPGDLASWTYHTRKKVSVQTTTAFLGAAPQRPDLTAQFLQSRKKDDFADSLLQGMAYCHNVRKSRPAAATATRTAATATAAATAATVRPRKPTEKQLAAGKFTKAGIAYMLLNDTVATAGKISKQQATKLQKALERCMQREFGSVDAARKACMRGTRLENK